MVPWSIDAIACSKWWLFSHELILPGQRVNGDSAVIIQRSRHDDHDHGHIGVIPPTHHEPITNASPTHHHHGHGFPPWPADENPWRVHQGSWILGQRKLGAQQQHIPSELATGELQYELGNFQYEPMWPWSNVSQFILELPMGQVLINYGMVNFWMELGKVDQCGHDQKWLANLHGCIILIVCKSRQEVSWVSIGCL